MGIVILIVNFLYIVLQVLPLVGLAAFAQHAVGSGPNDLSPNEANVISGAMLGLSLTMILLAVGNFVVAFGIMQTRRWAFILGIVLNGLNVIVTFGGHTALFEELSLAIYAGIGTYCVMRLMSALGPPIA